MEYVVTASHLCKKYKHFKALNDFSMHVPKGAIYGFVGKNGAGKTTLIRLLCGIQKPTSGEYTLYGIKSTDKKILQSQKRIGAVVETPSIYQNMTAEENMKEQYYLLGLPDFHDIPHILKLVGLEDTGKKKVKDFSLGMRQRLGIAIALAGKPDLLILDEPTNGLDPQGIIEIRELILKLNREQQITVLISSHILDELSKLATYYGFIDKGSMIKEIGAKELESVCQKCTELKVTDTSILTNVLDRMKLSYEILSDTKATIYGEIPISDLTLSLAEQNCRVLSIHEHDESLESYYINLVGGGRHE